MKNNSINRRRLLMGLAAAGVLPVPGLIAADKLLPATPSDAEGPFYPVEIPSDSDNDLLRVIGRNQASEGQLAYVQGRVMDSGGHRIDGARDRDFQGFGAMVTDRQGNYHFRTLRPVPYTGRTPHIHFRVTANGFDRLTTQLYVAEEASRNSEDFLYLRHSETDRALVTSSFAPLTDSPGGPVAAEFNIVLA
jgi:protocatechuate 3,4-dioxygenase beta subunit